MFATASARKVIFPHVLGRNIQRNDFSEYWVAAYSMGMHARGCIHAGQKKRSLNFGLRGAASRALSSRFHWIFLRRTLRQGVVQENWNLSWTKMPTNSLQIDLLNHILKVFCYSDKAISRGELKVSQKQSSKIKYNNNSCTILIPSTTVTRTNNNGIDLSPIMANFKGQGDLGNNLALP